MAAGATLVGGAGFSITHGFHTISHGENLSDLTLSYLVLAVSFVIEAVSWRKAMPQVRAEAGRLGVSRRAYVARTSDTALKAVLFEDSAALAGLVAAKIDFRDEASAAGLEIACDEVDRRLRERYPGIVQVFLDPTPTRADRRGE
ncbi:hypothetical protein [Nonomuraea dietziae]|uniref:hypothetical protein n=1 Tax=Nonomuraea dietziae TaxID=65515 RepID=UPI0033CAEC4A